MSKLEVVCTHCLEIAHCGVDVTDLFQKSCCGSGASPLGPAELDFFAQIPLHRLL